MSLRSISLTSVKVDLSIGDITENSKCLLEHEKDEELDLSMQQKNGDDFSYLYLGNIPKEFKSADMRFFFIDAIEKELFDCFHYRHRPELQQILGEPNPQYIANLDKKNNKSDHQDNHNSCCCIFRCFKKNSAEIMTLFNGKEWQNSAFEFKKKLVNIRIMKITASEPNSQFFRTKGEIKDQYHNTREQKLYLHEIQNLIELNPPTVMPNGNVGTPTKHFQKMISECRLPCSVIKRLGLIFPKGSKLYSSVKMDYADSSCKEKASDCIPDSEKEETNNESSSKEMEDANDNGAEEWDRYEALHDDVDNQARPKERLFEEDLEVKWEKGGSGLVFYTDSYFWNEMKGKDFDEDTVDDWDVDYSIYYEDGAGDKSARDQLKMRMEKRRRDGKADGPLKYSEIRRLEKRNRNKMGYAEFEKYSNAFGSRILQKQGWKRGEGVGSQKQGIKEPVNIEGQSSWKHTGLGFFGEKLDRGVSLKREAEKDVYISTVYDDKDGEELDAMRFHGLELLKYRSPKIQFNPADSSSRKSKQNNSSECVGK